MQQSRRRLEAELSLVRERIAEMGAEAAQMVEDAVRALNLDRDADHPVALTSATVEAAMAILQRDDALDAVEHDLEHHLLLLVAREQPVSEDLRLVGAALKVLGDLERVGDNAVNIARVAQRIGEAGLAGRLPETVAAMHGASRERLSLLRLQEVARSMVLQATTAFVKGDEEMGAGVIARDDEADVLFAECERELRGLLALPRFQDGPQIAPGQGSTAVIAYLLFVANYLERVCDHAVNVAERAIFLRTGRLPKHAADDLGKD